MTAARVPALVLRTRPTTVEARQITSANRDDVLAWINETGTAWPYGTRGVTWHDRDIGTIRDAFVGDWIVKTAFGETVRVKDSMIYALYESAIPGGPTE